LIGRGRVGTEKSVVLVEKGVYLGFGYFTEEMVINSPDEFKEYIDYYPDNQDIQRILNLHLRKDKKDVLINYEM